MTRPPRTRRRTFEESQTRYLALAERCPMCGASPLTPCIGHLGAPRKSVHRERIIVARAASPTGRLSRSQPEMQELTPRPQPFQVLASADFAELEGRVLVYLTQDERQRAWAALRMVRDAIEELFGPVASIESEEAVLLRGPEMHHEAEAIIAALQRVHNNQQEK